MGDADPRDFGDRIAEYHSCERGHQGVYRVFASCSGGSMPEKWSISAPWIAAQTLWTIRSGSPLLSTFALSSDAA
jgi:hypothetical protein